jgi:Kef-type K+ transport system membrane component KefB
MILLTLGALFLIGLVADVAGRLSPLPRVTLLLLSGILIGPSGFALLPQDFVTDWFPTLTHIALAMVGFLLGQKLTANELREHGYVVIRLALGKVAMSALLVFVVLTALGVDLVLALLFAGISTATAPAATFDVVHESKSEGTFADRLLSIVAIDDAWGLILFALLLAAAATISGDSTGSEMVASGLFEAGGSVVLGALLGVPMAFLTGRLEFGQRNGEPIQAEAFGFVLVCAGAASLLGLSPILAAMAMGSVVASVATHHKRPFAAIEGMEWPFMILFFILAGASLKLEEISGVGLVAIGYVIARGTGSYLGIFGTASLLKLDTATRRWMGLALMPQAGVALGMALIASQRFPQYAESIITTVLLTTVFLELISPVITRAVLRHVDS